MTQKPMPSIGTLLKLVELARAVFDRLPPAAANLPPEAKEALKSFYDLTDYHGIAPADAPHIPNDGLI